jgi:tripeptidyl-peptidase-1
VPLLRFRYGAHLSREQVAELVAPHQDTLEIVHSWLVHYGVPSSSISNSHGGGWLKITSVPVSQADDLLYSSYQLYRHTGTKDTEAVLRTVSYGLPAALHSHVKMVAPTTYFGSQRTPLQTLRKRSSEEAAVMVNATSGELVSVLSRRQNEVTPSLLRSLYKTETYVPAAIGQNTLGILGFNNEYPSQEDLTVFMGVCRRDARAATFAVERVNDGGYDPSLPGVEANVDTQYAGAMAFPTPQIFYSIGGKLRWSDNQPATGDPYLELFNYLIAQPSIPPTISLSYLNNETALPEEYATSICDLFARLGARGVSVLVASGDEGVGRGDCLDSSKNDQFIPTFPASCTCGDSSLLARSPHAQEVAHQATVLQVPLSPVLVPRRPASPRSLCPSPGAASHATFRVRHTRRPRCPPSSVTSETRMPASTSAFTRPIVI